MNYFVSYEALIDEKWIKGNIEIPWFESPIKNHAAIVALESYIQKKLSCKTVTILYWKRFEE